MYTWGGVCVCVYVKRVCQEYVCREIMHRRTGGRVGPTSEVPRATVGEGGDPIVTGRPS